MGRKLVLTGTKLTNLAAPKLATIDSILPEAGALLFLDPSHPYQPWGTWDLNSTSPFNVPNLAYDQAKLMVPTGTAATLGASYQKNSVFKNDSLSSKVERTVKGGLHVTYSQTVGDTTVNENIGLMAGSAINPYLLANKAHSFYFAKWGRITRGALAFDAGTEPHMTTNGNSALPIFYTRPATSGDTQYPTNATRLNHYGEGVTNTAGKGNTPIFQDLQVSDMNALAANPALMPVNLSKQGGPNNLKAGSMVFYGFYLEDLTVSGRSYATVDALLKAKYEKDVKTAGGRYYADTFTAPLA
jgi:hypothetical protein